MKNFYLGCLLSIAFLIALGMSAHADIEVNPSKKRPTVSLDGTRVTRPNAESTPAGQQGGPSVPATSPDHAPLRLPTSTCKVDPIVGNYGCPDLDPAEPDEDDEDPELTPGDVLRAVKEIGLPSLQVKVQPGERTLVNVDTIFYAEPQPFERSVELLGFDVDLVAEPVSYLWIHGDGSVTTTDRPGRPYPAMDVTHRYVDPADGVQTRVDVTYRVRFRVDSGPWQTIPETLVASGPIAALDVKEAAPVLAKP